MKKSLALLLLLVLLVGLFCGCNQQLIDTTWSYERAIVYSPSGEVITEGRVSSWKDYENSDSIQVVIDGKSYYTHLSNVVLISE